MNHSSVSPSSLCCFSFRHNLLPSPSNCFEELMKRGRNERAIGTSVKHIKKRIKGSSFTSSSKDDEGCSMNHTWMTVSRRRCCSFHLHLLPSWFLNYREKHNENKDQRGKNLQSTTRENPEVRRTKPLIGVATKEEHWITSKSNSSVGLSPFWLKLAACLWKLFPLAPPLASCFLFHRHNLPNIFGQQIVVGLFLVLLNYSKLLDLQEFVY